MILDIRVTEEYEIRALDSMNWQVWQFKSVKHKDSPDTEEWVATGNYFSRLDSAIEWIWHQLPRKRKNGTVMVIQDALRALRGMLAEVNECADRVEKAVEGKEKAKGKRNGRD